MILLFDEYIFMWNLKFDDPTVSLFSDVIHFTFGISVCMMTFAQIYFHRMFYRPTHVYIRKYPSYYPKELMILSCYMINTWFSRMICKFSGIDFEDRILILENSKEVHVKKCKKPPGNKKKMKDAEIPTRKLTQKNKKRQKRFNNKRFCKLGILAALNIVSQCPTLTLSSNKKFARSLRKCRSRQGILNTTKVSKEDLPRLQSMLEMNAYHDFIPDNSMFKVMIDTGSKNTVSIHD